MGEISKYLFDRDEINDLYKKTGDIKENLEEAFKLSKAFFETLEETDLWEGRSKDKLEAFYHLVLQYHGQLVGETVESIGKVDTVKVWGRPCEHAIKALEECTSNMDYFTEVSFYFRNLYNM